MRYVIAAFCLLALSASPALAGPLTPIIVAAFNLQGLAASVATFVINTVFAIGVSKAGSRLFSPSRVAVEHRESGEEA